MITINNFKISSDATKIEVSLETSVGETITNALLWSNKTFQDYNLAIDLSSKLEQTSNIETFTIELSDLGIYSFTGLYFLEVCSSEEDCSSNKLLGIASNLNSYTACMLDKIMKITACQGSDCNDSLLDTINNISVLLEGINIAVNHGFYNEAIDLLNILEKLCPTDCVTCNNLQNYTTKSGLNFSTLNNTLIIP